MPQKITRKDPVLMEGKEAPAAEGVGAEEVGEEETPVEYVEFADAYHFEVRTITKQDWDKLGVQDGHIVHWHKGNNFRVPRDEFGFLNEEQFERYILADPRLRLVTE